MVVRLTRLREERLKRAMTQDELAQAAGVTRVTIARLEAGVGIPQPKTVRKIAAALGVRTEELVEIVNPGEAAA